MFAQRSSRHHGVPNVGAVPPPIYDPSWVQAALASQLMMQNAAAGAGMSALLPGQPYPYLPPWSAVPGASPLETMPPQAHQRDLLPARSGPPGLQLGSSGWTPEHDTTVFARGDPMKVNLPDDLEGPRRRRSQKARRAAAAAAAANAPVPPSMLAAARAGNSETDEDNLPIVDNHPLSMKWGEPMVLCNAEAPCADLIQAITDGPAEERHEIAAWLLPYVKPLSLSKQGTHIVQKMLEVGQKADKERITAELKPFTRELYESAHGNHVLAKIVEQLPSATVLFVVREFLGQVREVARHQYGCRILERLIEHCEDDGDMATLIDEVVSDSEPLCRHPFGNFVVQHLLEHGSIERREGIHFQVAHKLPALAMHRTASHFVQQLVSYSEPAVQERIVRSLLQAEEPNSFQEITGSRYGSFVVEQLAGIDGTYEEVRNALMEVFPLLTPAQVKFAKRVIDKFDLKNVVKTPPS